MPDARSLADLFTVAERFRRSVHVASDYSRGESLSGYIITPLTRAVLMRIASGMQSGARGRAWSVTGPYGAGKSACMLFAAQVLGYPVNDRAREMVRAQNRPLYDHLKRISGWERGGYAVVPVVGSRQPLAWTLLEGLIESLKSLEPILPQVRRQRRSLQGVFSAARSGAILPPSELISVFEETASQLQRADPTILGMLIVYDELGKSLEYATLNPGRGDTGLLQMLAEAATRSGEPVIGLITVLHQAFEHYAAALSPIQQREWAKVQGRFEDIGFLASPGEMLTLVGEAIQPVVKDEHLARVISAEVDIASQLQVLPRDLNAQDARAVLAGCAPLHPSVALVLGRLFRSRLAQNERSLFAFLSSGEPFGLQEFLHQTTWSSNGRHPFYRLDNLYDYVVSALGSTLYVQASGKRWAEIEESLHRLPNEATGLEARLVKAIGMLGLLGDQRYMRASASILAWALEDGAVPSTHIDAALERLVSWRVAIYQSFRDAYALWQGSDVDLDALWEDGLSQVERSRGLSELLRETDELRPYVAKRHLHETGTFRFLTPWILDLEDLGLAAERDLGDADGALVFVLPPVGTLLDDVTSRIVEFSGTLPSWRRMITLFAVPQHTGDIRAPLDELQVWEWMAENIPALEGDSVARRELAARRSAAQERLKRALSRTFDLSSSYASCIWIHQGQQLRFRSARELSTVVSDMCDRAYCEAPVVRNELINRRSLSSAVAAARRNLLERMLEYGDRERLGIDGYPPELSIYLSVLESSGLHHRTADGWAFGPIACDADRGCGSGPQGTPGADPARVLPMWRAMDHFLETTEREAQPVTALYALLAGPPYGIREGLLPIYLTVALLRWKGELALYEEGTFVPQPGMPELERLLRAPERFAIRRYRQTETRFRILHAYCKIFDHDADPAQVSVLSAVRPLIAFAARLPRYAVLTTTLSPETIAVREALLNAREPQPLLFEQLPRAVGLDPVGPEDLDQVPILEDSLRHCLLELQDAYGRLLERVRRELCDALLLPAELDAARREIGQRAQVIQPWVADLELKPFAMRLADEELASREWLESVAAVLVHKPPSSWNDADEQQYRAALRGLAGRFRRTEDIALESADHEPTSASEGPLRLGITSADGREERQVLRKRPEDGPALQEMVTMLESTLKQGGVERRVQLLALAELARKLMSDQGKDKHHE